MVKVKLKQAGFTLVELVVAAGLVGLLSIGLVNMFTSTIRGSQRARLQAEVKAQGDYALVKMERQLRNAIKLPTLDDSGLSFSVKENNQIIDYIYAFDQLSKKLTINATDLFADPVTVSNVTFTPVSGSGLDPGSVKISFTLVATSQGIQVRQDFQTTVAMRSLK